jgi:signal transduction histidine kinase
MKYLTLLILLIAYSLTKGQICVNGENNYLLDGHVLFFQEEENISIKEVWNYYISDKFKNIRAPNNAINLGFVKNIYWIALPIENSLNTTQHLEAGIENGGIFKIDFYLISSDGGKLMSKYTTGDKFNFNSRPIDHRHFYFPINLVPFEKAILFYRIDMRGNNMFLPLKLIKAESNERMDTTIGLFYAFFSGWASFVSLFALIVFLFTRERIYLWYSLYIIVYCLFFLADGDFDFKWFYPNCPKLGTITPLVYGLGINMFMLLFMNDFLRLKKEQKKLFRISISWVIFLIGAIILVVIGYTFLENIPFRTLIYNYCLVGVLGSWCIKIISIAVRIRDGYKPTYIYASGLSGLFFSATIYVIHTMGFINYTIPTFIYIPIGFFTEIILMSLALVYNYNYYKKQQQELSLSFTRQELEFSQKLLEVQESEQKRIADDLHDELGGDLAALKMKIQSLDFANNVKKDTLKMIDRASENTRAIAHNLMPPDFLETDLLTLLKDYIEILNRSSSIHFNLFTSASLIQLEKRHELALYRIIMEITNNIIKHSNASEATIQFLNYETNLEIMVEDNGKGFDKSVSGGLGLKSINTRINILQGEIDIDSNILGTTIIIKIPQQKEMSYEKN